MNEISLETIYDLRSRLEKSWDKDTAYEPYGGEKNLSLGQCYVSALVAFIEFEYLNPTLVRGDVGRGDNDHFWLEVDGKILDLTADQFSEFKLPEVVWGTYEEFPNYIPQYRDSGFARFLKLARRSGIEISSNGSNSTNS